MIGAGTAHSVEVPGRFGAQSRFAPMVAQMSLRSSPAGLSMAEASGLITRIAMSRDRQAFAILFAYYFPRVKAYLLRVGATSSAAEELAQETMLRVWRKAESYDPQAAAASTWIFVIARNLRIDRLRGERLANCHEPDPSEEPDAPATGESIVILSERDARVRQALGALSAEQARIIELFYFDEHPHSEIARMLGVPLGTVKSRVRLAVRRLRAELEDLEL
jgi:RNA polymerase sigma-70 factor (ECF subfamily)